MHSLAMHLVKSATHYSGNFLNTSFLLVTRPWKAVRMYIRGKRVSIMSPVTMLLVLSLYWGLAISLLAPGAGTHGTTGIAGALYGSITLQYIFMSIPVAIATWAVYRTDMRGRFNMAELLIATLYFACSFLLVAFVMSPLELLGQGTALCSYSAVILVLGTVSLLKAFPQPKRWLYIVKLSLWLIISCILLLVFLTLYAIPLYGGA